MSPGSSVGIDSLRAARSRDRIPSRFKWPCGLRRVSAAYRLLELRVRIPPGACLLYCKGLKTNPAESWQRENTNSGGLKWVLVGGGKGKGSPLVTVTFTLHPANDHYEKQALWLWPTLFEPLSNLECELPEDSTIVPMRWQVGDLSCMFYNVSVYIQNVISIYFLFKTKTHPSTHSKIHYFREHTVGPENSANFCTLSKSKALVRFYDSLLSGLQKFF